MKKDNFLEHLLNHLEKINEYDVCQIWWTDELQTVLVGNPNMHPWFGSDMANATIVIIQQYFYNRCEYFEAHEIACEIAPNLKTSYTNGDAHEHFLHLAHNLIIFDEPFYFCTGIENRIFEPKNYVFSCKCHQKSYAPILINQANDWFSYIDLMQFFPKTVIEFNKIYTDEMLKTLEIAKLFPKKIEGFEERFKICLEVIKRTDFANQPYLFEFELTDIFKESLVNRTSLKRNIVWAVVARLTLTDIQIACHDGLRYEYLKNIKQYRFRVTQETRIHYKNKDGKFIFLRYYGEGEHDDGL